MATVARTTSGGRGGRGPRALPPATPPELPPATPPEQPEGSTLAAAVLRVQDCVSKLPRNAKGQVGSRTYGYTTLDVVTDEVLPLLVENDLLWRTFPTRDDQGPALRYRMTHIPSGESDEDVMALLGCTDSQGQGSALTYARRYALTAYLNLTADPDDDGAAASQQAAPQSQTSTSQAPQPTAAAPKPSERAATAKQRGMLEAKAKSANLSSGALANLILQAAGDPPRAWRSEEHASQTLARLIDRLPARLVTQVKEAIG